MRDVGDAALSHLMGMCLGRHLVGCLDTGYIGKWQTFLDALEQLVVHLVHHSLALFRRNFAFHNQYLINSRFLYGF